MLHDTEAERRVLSAILHSETACIEAFNNLSPEQLYVPINQHFYSCAKNIYQKGAKPTYVEIAKELSDLGLLTKETMTELHDVAGQYIDDHNVKYWCNRVSNAYKARRADLILKQYTDKLTKTKDIHGFIQGLSNDISSLAMESDIDDVITGAEIAEMGIKLVEENCERWRRNQEDANLKGLIPLEGVPTGLHRLDELTLGYKPGDLIILGAQTGHGKTAFALNTANAACVEGKKPILYVNTEMSKKQITYRWGSILGRQSQQGIRFGSLKNGEKANVITGYKVLAESGFLAYYAPNLTPERLQTVAKKYKMQNDIELLIVDYVGRMEKTDPRLAEWQVLEQIVKSMKLLAQNLEIAVLILVQLNPDNTLQGAKRMKNECDLMLKLIPVDEDEDYTVKFQYEDGFNYRLLVDKSRDSASGISIPLVFDMDLQYMREALAIERR